MSVPVQDNCGTVGKELATAWSTRMAPFNPLMLAAKGALYFHRPTLATHVAPRQSLAEGADRLIDVVSRGVVKVGVNQH